LEASPGRFSRRLGEFFLRRTRRSTPADSAAWWVAQTKIRNDPCGTPVEPRGFKIQDRLCFGLFGLRRRAHLVSSISAWNRSPDSLPMPGQRVVPLKPVSFFFGCYRRLPSSRRNAVPVVRPDRPWCPTAGTNTSPALLESHSAGMNPIRRLWSQHPTPTTRVPRYRFFLGRSATAPTHRFGIPPRRPTR